MAKIIALPPVADRLIARAQRAPYTHITSADGKTIYMGRWWLFNPYGRDADDNATDARWRWLPSIRVHHIMRPDQDRDLHDHPWNARTVVLHGWYTEERPWGDLSDRRAMAVDGLSDDPDGVLRGLFHRRAGHTGRLLFAQYHRISQVSPGGVWTLFFTWRPRGEWGFLVNGKKVPWKTYLAEREQSQ
ncbi:hypothetical protein [Xylophilus ampelinus]|uniref:hypothetical protein n=1 Tax=Xylophilus ampelinus TaxID=54067 RepID=UPI0018F21E5A|nr:hypothetical protein [Xylophilus ampelinus]MCS4509169.1 hypothetical protein [Xylophilus ampelinus]